MIDSCVVICLPPMWLPCASSSPTYNALFSLEQFPLFPQEKENSDICPRLQVRAEAVVRTYLPDAQNSVTNDYRMHAWHALDLPPRWRIVTLGTQCNLSESTMCQVCSTHRARTHGEPGMAGMSEPLHVRSTLCVRAHSWVPSCRATKSQLHDSQAAGTFAGSLFVRTADLRAAVGQPFGDSENLPVNLNTFLTQPPCSHNGHGGIESSSCHCRKQPKVTAL